MSKGSRRVEKAAREPHSDKYERGTNRSGRRERLRRMHREEAELLGTDAVYLVQNGTPPEPDEITAMVAGKYTQREATVLYMLDVAKKRGAGISYDTEKTVRKLIEVHQMKDARNFLAKALGCSYDDLVQIYL